MASEEGEGGGERGHTHPNTTQPISKRIEQAHPRRLAVSQQLLLGMPPPKQHFQNIAAAYIKLRAHLHRLEVGQQLLLGEVRAAKQHVQVAGLVQAELDLAALEVLDGL